MFINKIFLCFIDYNVRLCVYFLDCCCNLPGTGGVSMVTAGEDPSLLAASCWVCGKLR